MDHLLLIDYARLKAGRAESLAALRTACHDIGFFYLVNHPVSHGLWDEVFAQSRRFFDLPVAEKHAIHISKSAHYRGYSQVGAEITLGRPDYKEVLDLGTEAAPRAPTEPYHILHGPNQWPDPELVPRFSDVITDYMTELAALGGELMQALSAALGLPPSTLAPAFRDPYYILRLIHYPPQNPELGPLQPGVGEHTDYGCFTILAQDDVGGLEVRTSEGTWIAALPIPYAYVVNLGDMMQIWTANYCVATPHRVTNISAKRGRVSVPFFFEPSLDALIEPLSDLRGLDFKVTRHRDLPVVPTVYGAHILKAYQRSYPDVTPVP